MLDPCSRTAIAALAALCVAGAITLAPTRARGSIGQPHVARITADTTVAPRERTPLSIVRDPFAEPRPPAPARPEGDVGPVGALPSNLTRDTIPALPGAAADPPARGSRITAIVTGAHPYALVESDGVHAIKGIGDRIGGQLIRTIGLDGIRLQDGEQLPVDAAQP